jgi:hypothetical protein
MARRRSTVRPLAVTRIERADFIGQGYWDHRAGEHVTILGPTGWGKTQLAFDLLRPISTPDEPSVILCMKARDSTVERYGKEMKFKRLRNWPPPITYSNKRSPIRPPGYLLWPKFTGDPETDEHRQHDEFRSAMIGCMKRGKGVKVFADEVADLKEIKLERTLSHCYRQGRSMGAAFFSATQRPFGAPPVIYGGSVHLFIGKDDDRRSQLRYGEIGGWDEEQITATTMELNTWEWLYMRKARDGKPPVMCVVGA